MCTKPLLLLLVAAVAVSGGLVASKYILPSMEAQHTPVTFTGTHHDLRTVLSVAQEHPERSCGDLIVVNDTVCICNNGIDYMKMVLNYVRTDLALTRFLISIEASIAGKYNATAAALLRSHIRLLEKKAAQLEEAFRKSDLRLFVCLAQEYIELRERLMREDTRIMAQVSGEALREALTEWGQLENQGSTSLREVLEELAVGWNRVGEEIARSLDSINATLAEEVARLSVKTAEAIDQLQLLSEKLQKGQEGLETQLDKWQKEMQSNLQSLSETMNKSLGKGAKSFQEVLRELEGSMEAAQEQLEDLMKAVNASNTRLIQEANSLSNQLKNLQEDLERLQEEIGRLGQQLQLNITLPSKRG